MPNQLLVNPEDSLTAIAQRELGDFSKWRDIADLNQLNPLQGLVPGDVLTVPTKEEILSQAEPILNQVSSQITSALASVEQQLTTYTQIAQSALAEVNGVIGEVETVLSEVQQGLGKRDYKGQVVRLVDWLLQ